VSRAALEILAIALVHGTVLAALTWVLVRLLGRRLGPSLVAALWAVVLLKFVVPVGPAMPYSPSDLIEWLRDGDTGRGPILAAPIAVAGPGLATAAAPSTPWWPTAVLAAWLVGVGVVLARAAGGQRRARAAAAALPAGDDTLVAQVAALAARVGAPMPLVRVGAGGAPYLVGVVRTYLVVPGPLLAAEPSVRAAALVHELTHLRRRDPYWAVLATLVRAAFFFFPVARWAVAQFEAAREAACDASALATTAVSPPAYARLLLTYAAAPATPAGGVGLAARGRRSLARRIDAALGAPVTGRGLGPVAWLVLAGWTALALAGARPAAARHPASELCLYSPQIALELLASFPEADRDGDGDLTRDEACDLQVELRRRGDDPALLEAPAPGDDPAAAWLTGRLCCNCDQGEGTSSAPSTSSGPSAVDPAIAPSSTCRDEEGALP
jgi:beta-lactamase regulating signal transducer with metallopeptidase domain